MHKIPFLIVLSLLVVGTAHSFDPTLFVEGSGHSPVEAGVGVCWSQPPNLDGGLLSSEVITSQLYESEMADDFVLFTGGEVVNARWWGGYFAYNPGDPLVQNFVIRVYEEGGCLPVNLIQEFIIPSNANETFIYEQPGGSPIAEYQAPMSLPVEPGLPLWLSIQAGDHPFPPQWGRLEAAFADLCEGAFRSDFFSFPDWVPTTVAIGQPFDASLELECDDGKLTPEEAITILIDDIIPQSPFADELVAFIVDGEGPDGCQLPGTLVEPWDGAWAETIIDPTYLFWLDLEAGAEFIHPTAFVFMNAFTGDYFLLDAESWPVIDGTPRELMTDGNDSPNRVYGNYNAIDEPYTYTPVDTENTDEWAVVAVGKNLSGEGERKARANDLARVLEILNGVPLGPKVDKDNIKVVSGANVTGGRAVDICEELEGLDGDCTKLYFFYLGHGNRRGMIVKRAGSNRDTTLTYEQLACKLLETGIQEVCVSIEACHSGAAIPKLLAKEVDGKKLKGEAVTSSSRGNTTFRTDCDGTPFYIGMNACFKDPESDLNQDGKIKLPEAVAWAIAQDPNGVGVKKPQGATLGDGKRIEFANPRTGSFWSRAAGGRLDFEWRKIYYKVKKGAAGGQRDSLVCRTRLYMKSHSDNQPYRARHTIRIICTKKGGGTEVIVPPFRPRLGAKQRLCIADVPSICKRLIVQRVNNLLAAVDEDVSPTLDLRTSHYQRGEYIFQEHGVTGIPGEAFSSSVETVPGWGLTSDPPVFNFPAFPDTEYVLVRGFVPDTATIGAEFLSRVVNETLVDTSLLSIQALLEDSLGNIVDGDAFDYQALKVDGAISSDGVLPDGPGVILRNTIVDFITNSTSLIDTNGMLTAINSSVRPDSGSSFTFEVRGNMDWQNSTVIDATDGLHLDGATGAALGGGSLSSRGDGLVARGDLSGLEFAFFEVDSSAGDGAVFHAATGVLFENLAIEHTVGTDVVLRNGSIVELRDAIYEDGSIDVEAGSELTRTWTTNIITVDLDDSVMANVDVEVRDVTNAVVGNSTTDASGFAEQLALIQYVQSGATQSLFTPHMITVTFGAWDTSFVHTADEIATIEVILPREATGVDDDDIVENLPRQFALYPSAPNPLRVEAMIRYALPWDEKVVLTLHDVSGRLVRRLVDERRPAGIHDVRIERDELPGGVYFYRLDAGRFEQTRKLVIVNR